MTTLTKASNPDQMNRRLLIGAIALAGIAALLVFLVLNKAGGSKSTSSPLSGGQVNAVVATGDLAAGTKLTAGDLKTSTLPQSAAVSGAITDSSALVGLVLRYPVSAGEQFTSIKVGQGAKTGGIEGIIPSGKRAMAVEVSENTSVGGLIVAGNHVDVVAVVNSQDPAGGQLSRGITLIQNVEVLSVAQRAQKATARLDKSGNPIQTNTANGSIATTPDDTSADPSAKTVTLAIDPNDAPLLAVAQTQGTVFLSLRGGGDDKTLPATSRTLLSP